MGFVTIGICFLMIISFGTLSYAYSLPGAFFIIVLVFAFIAFFLALNLYRHAVNIREAADYSEWGAMEKGLASLCNAYTIYGLLMLLAVLVVLIAIVYWCIVVLPSISNLF